MSGTSDWLPLHEGPRQSLCGIAAVDGTNVDGTNVIVKGTAILARGQSSSIPKLCVVHSVKAVGDNRFDLEVTLLVRKRELPVTLRQAMAEHEAAYTSSRTVIQEADVLHPCKVFFGSDDLPPMLVRLKSGVQPCMRKGFVCMRFYDHAARSLLAADDAHISSKAQSELRWLRQRTALLLERYRQEESSLSCGRDASANASIPISSSCPLPAGQKHDAGSHGGAYREPSEAQQTAQAAVGSAIRELLEVLPQAASDEAWSVIARCIQVLVASLGRLAALSSPDQLAPEALEAERKSAVAASLNQLAEVAQVAVVKDEAAQQRLGAAGLQRVLAVGLSLHPGPQAARQKVAILQALLKLPFTLDLLGWARDSGCVAHLTSCEAEAQEVQELSKSVRQHWKHSVKSQSQDPLHSAPSGAAGGSHSLTAALRPVDPSAQRHTSGEAQPSKADASAPAASSAGVSAAPFRMSSLRARMRQRLQPDRTASNTSEVLADAVPVMEGSLSPPRALQPHAGQASQPSQLPAAPPAAVTDAAEPQPAEIASKASLPEQSSIPQAGPHAVSAVESGEGQKPAAPVGPDTAGSSGVASPEPEAAAEAALHDVEVQGDDMGTLGTVREQQGVHVDQQRPRKKRRLAKAREVGQDGRAPEITGADPGPSKRTTRQSARQPLADSRSPSPDSPASGPPAGASTEQAAEVIDLVDSDDNGVQPGEAVRKRRKSRTSGRRNGDGASPVPTAAPARAASKRQKREPPVAGSQPNRARLSPSGQASDAQQHISIKVTGGRRELHGEYSIEDKNILYKGQWISQARFLKKAKLPTTAWDQQVFVVGDALNRPLGEYLEECCAVCGSPLDEPKLLMCSNNACKHMFHTYCLQPPMLRTPPDEVEWYCPDCSDGDWTCASAKWDRWTRQAE